MKLHVLGCYGGVTQYHRVTGFLLNEHILLDPGSAAESLPLEAQRRIDAAIISHSHLDHCASLAFLADNIFADAKTPIRIIATSETAAAIQSHLLNGTMWPDFTAIKRTGSSVAVIEHIRPGQPKRVGELVVTPFSVEHSVPTVGFVISEGQNSMLYSADTSDLGPIVQRASETDNLKLVLVEASFPNKLRELARKTGHLVPEQLEALVSLVGVPVRLFHMKPRYVEQIATDAAALGGDVALLEQGEVIEF